MLHEETMGKKIKTEQEEKYKNEQSQKLQA